MKAFLAFILLLSLLTSALKKRGNLSENPFLLHNQTLSIRAPPEWRLFTQAETSLLRGAMKLAIHALEAQPARRLVLFTGGAIASVTFNSKKKGRTLYQSHIS